MPNQLFKIVMTMLTTRFLKRQMHALNLRAVRAYVEGVDQLRMGAVAITNLVFYIALMPLGIALIFGSLLWFFRLSAETYAYTALGVGVLLCLVPAILMSRALSEKRWMQVSRANEMVAAVLPPPPVPSVKQMAKEVRMELDRQRSAQALAHEADRQAVARERIDKAIPQMQLQTQV
jgi:hypothetical protein